MKLYFHWNYSTHYGMQFMQALLQFCFYVDVVHKTTIPNLYKKFPSSRPEPVSSDVDVMHEIIYIYIYNSRLKLIHCCSASVQWWGSHRAELVSSCDVELMHFNQESCCCFAYSTMQNLICSWDVVTLNQMPTTKVDLIRELFLWPHKKPAVLK